MEKRKYTKIQALEREIAEQFRLERIQVKRCLERFRLRQRKQAAGIQPRPEGRPHKGGQPAHQGEAAELKRLWMQLWLEGQGIHRSPKTVLRIMKKYGVLSELRRPRKCLRFSNILKKLQKRKVKLQNPKI